MQRTLFVIMPLLFAAGCAPQADDGRPPGYPVRPVPFTDVHLTDAFWAERLTTNREVTIPHAFRQEEETGRVDNFRRAAGLQPGTFCTTYPFDDTDVYKTIEGAAYALSQQYDSALDAQVDSLITVIAAAQEPDGYLYPFGVLPAETDEQKERKAWWYGSKRWEKDHLHSHELYNAGHLYEAAVAHYQATGKRSLLDVALKNADLVVETFGTGPDQIQTIPGHPVIEMGLVKLYRVTGEQKYLDLADFFLAGRGDPKFGKEGGEYWQNHKPVKRQTAAVGHAVRATYLYSGMADVGVLKEDRAYLDAIDRIWEDVVGTKLYLIGGIGAAGENEGFQGAYTLPNLTAYNETCAAVANAMWNHRLFLLHGDAKYIDVLERSLYNNVLAGVSLEGDRFFYPNPLESDGDYGRSPWFGCACCIGNVARFIPSVPGYVYAVQGDTAYVNLFVSNETTLDLAGTPVRFEQQTDYPWDGGIRLVVTPEEERRFTVKVRVPGWARNAPVPSGLYRYVNEAPGAPVLRLNGEEHSLDLDRGYAVLTRAWRAGDTVALDLPMAVRTVVAHDSVAADRGKVALERGPLVYAAESIDNGDAVRALALDAEAAYETAWRPDLLKGITVVEGTAYDDGQPQPFTALPYYAWAHRGDSQMAVWFDRK